MSHIANVTYREKVQKKVRFRVLDAKILPVLYSTLALIRVFVYGVSLWQS
jgi:hypothetical protein